MHASIASIEKNFRTIKPTFICHTKEIRSHGVRKDLVKTCVDLIIIVLCVLKISLPRTHAALCFSSFVLFPPISSAMRGSSAFHLPPRTLPDIQFRSSEIEYREVEEITISAPEGSDPPYSYTATSHPQSS